jgi:hypothetical protein
MLRSSSGVRVRVGPRGVQFEIIEKESDGRYVPLERHWLSPATRELTQEL